MASPVGVGPARPELVLDTAYIAMAASVGTMLRDAGWMANRATHKEVFGRG